MQKEISPKAIIGVVAGLVVLIGVLFYVFNQRSGGAGTLEGQTPPGPPADFAQRMSGARTGPGAAPTGAPAGAPGR
ncbi:MAG: hypothetical protein ACKO5K_16100 [Armatimonadota bacterium]